MRGWVRGVALLAILVAIFALALSRQHRQGHIPGAWFAIRARLAEALDKLPAQGDLVLTSEDGRVARFAAAELRTRRPVKLLTGGTAAWKAAGLPLETGMGPLAQGKTIKREAWDNLLQYLSPFQSAAQELRRGTPVRQ